MLKKLIIFLLVSLLIVIGYLWFFKKPNPIPAPENKVVTYQGADKSELQKKYGKILIVYYSFTGVTHDVISDMQKRTGADTYPIQPVEAYPASAMLYITSLGQLNDNKLPELKDIKAQIADYDTIIVGSPVWWYTVPPPVRSYLAQTDFQGKKLGIFCTNGGNVGAFYTDITAFVKNADIAEHFMGLKNPHRQKAQELEQLIVPWLKQFEK